ncbi:MAG: hypothetical protein KME35_09270 [Aphanocapsa sp. GSE-SYN-MK-11-07L]|nr:hypothetical protein [Aphanocapsa sp. GSE-SYN-MK-11-07L]
MVKVVLVLVFALTFLTFGVRLSIQNSEVSNTFSIVNKILERIYDYVDDFHDIDSENLNNEAQCTAQNIIEDQISGLTYSAQKINLWQILFSLALTFLVIYMSGDSLVFYIKEIASILGFGEFNFFRELNVEGLVIILFPLGVALAKDIMTAALQKRNENLRRSLAMLKKHL